MPKGSKTNCTRVENRNVLMRSDRLLNAARLLTLVVDLLSHFQVKCCTTELCNNEVWKGSAGHAKISIFVIATLVSGAIGTSIYFYQHNEP